MWKEMVGGKEGANSTPWLWKRLPFCSPNTHCGSYLRISQEEVGPDFVDMAQHGSPRDPQQALQ